MRAAGEHGGRGGDALAAAQVPRVRGRTERSHHPAALPRFVLLLLFPVLLVLLLVLLLLFPPAQVHSTRIDSTIFFVF